MYGNQAPQVGNSQCLGMLHQDGRLESLGGLAMQAANKPQSAPGVVEMTAGAHQAFEVLSQSLGDLMAKVSPLVEPYPEPGCAGGNQNQSCEASAITNLRLLIERINDKKAEIQRLTAALRV